MRNNSGDEGCGSAELSPPRRVGRDELRRRGGAGSQRALHVRLGSRALACGAGEPCGRCELTAGQACGRGRPNNITERLGADTNMGSGCVRDSF